MRSHRLVSPLFVAASLCLAGCSDSGQKAAAPAAPGSRATAAAPRAEGVQWPALRTFDEMTHRADALVDAKKIAELRKLAPELLLSAQAVATELPPVGAKNADRVKLLQSDLITLCDALLEHEKMEDASLSMTAQAMHPLALQLMEAAGLPHVHAPADQAQNEEGGHGVGPNGGYVFHWVLPLHGEFVVEPATGRAVIFASDGEDLKPFRLDDPTAVEVTLQFETNAGAQGEVALVPEGGGAELSFGFLEATDADLKGAASVEGTLSGRIRHEGNIVTFKEHVHWPVVDGHHDHDHSGHDH